LLQKIDNKMF